MHAPFHNFHATAAIPLTFPGHVARVAESKRAMAKEMLIARVWDAATDGFCHCVSSAKARGAHHAAPLLRSLGFVVEPLSDQPAGSWYDSDQDANDGNEYHTDDDDVDVDSEHDSDDNTPLVERVIVHWRHAEPSAFGRAAALGRLTAADAAAIAVCAQLVEARYDIARACSSGSSSVDINLSLHAARELETEGFAVSVGDLAADVSGDPVYRTSVAWDVPAVVDAASPVDVKQDATPQGEIKEQRSIIYGRLWNPNGVHAELSVACSVPTRDVASCKETLVEALLANNICSDCCQGVEILAEGVTAPTYNEPNDDVRSIDLFMEHGTWHVSLGGKNNGMVEHATEYVGQFHRAVILA